MLYTSHLINNSVYSGTEMLQFLQQSFRSIGNIEKCNNDEVLRYIAIMGADYVRFLFLYGARENIYRDRNVSLFARSIWNTFYAQQTNDKVITLNYFMQKFYYDSKNLVLERHGYEQLRKSWDMLKNYIEKHYPAFVGITQQTIVPNVIRICIRLKDSQS